MNFPEREISSGPKSFVSEKDIEEKKKKRQEDWEKTRGPDDPLGEFSLKYAKGCKRMK